MLEMIDGGDRDEKILCVPDKDPRYSKVRSLQDLAPHRLNEIAEFSDLQKFGAKITEIRGWQDVDQVMPLVKSASKPVEKKSDSDSKLSNRRNCHYISSKHNAAHAL